MKHSINNSERTLLFMTGIAAGAAATYFLNTPKGKELRKVAMNKTVDLKNAAVEKGIAIQKEFADKKDGLVDGIKSKSVTVIDYAAQTLNNLQEQVSDAAYEFADTVEETTDSFASGAEKAKNNIKKSINAK